MKYTLDDIFVVQAPLSNIDSRVECNPFHSNGMLPLFTAPMTSVVDLNNYTLFKENGINPIIPRTVDLSIRKTLCFETWCAFSLEEFISFTNINSLIIDKDKNIYALIDIANGNMKKLHDTIRHVKGLFGNRIQIMAGNIANPEGYRLLSDAGADYVRIGIGTGSVCVVDGTKIKLQNKNEIEIENIQIKDNVKTHIGDNIVINSIRYDNTKSDIFNVNNEIQCTHNHKFWAVNKSDIDFVTDENINGYAFWVKAKDLDIDKHYLIKLI